MSKMKLAPLVTSPIDGQSLTESKLETPVTVSSKEFAENFADSAQLGIVDGQTVTIYNDKQSPMNGFYKVK